MGRHVNRRPKASLDRPVDPLRAYKSKRDFGVTPEPRTNDPADAGRLTYVVQKHWARNLHYDFRLELDGTMRSWAVPKGPSFDPSIKRMAVQVEDHPLAYAEFEGSIPARQYGAGKVIVWDSGTWIPLQDPRQGIRDGNLKFDLHGQKLKGRWVLVRMQGKGKKQAPWLLIKENDAYARPSVDYSVVDELPESVHARHPASSDVAPAGKTRRSTCDVMLPVDAVPAHLPLALAPQLATLVAGAPPRTAEWLYEIKFDGYRMLVRNDVSGARLLTRNGHDWTAKLQPLRTAFERLKLPAGWYDGEVVLPDKAGIPDFGALQQAFEKKCTHDVVLYLFDVPYAAGHDLRGAPLEARRAFLKRLLAASISDRIRFSEEFDVPPHSMVAAACKLGLEGIIGKRRSATYQSSRSTDWIKLKCRQRQEFVVGGYTEPQGARASFGALLLGVNDSQGTLRYAGHVGTGFTRKVLKDIRTKLDARRRGTSPFAVHSKFPGRPNWVDPTLVAEVSFAEWTRAGHIRHGVFRSLRSDKNAGAITREAPMRLPSSRTTPVSAASAEPTLSARLQVTNPQRVIDVSTGTTKLELVRYYALVGDLMMAHVRGRPMSVVRAPEGVDGQLFYQRHAGNEKLSGIRKLDPSLAIGHAPMIEVAGKQGLLCAAQWNVIEFHTTNAGSASYEHPDRMVFDLDPGEDVNWAQVQEAALLVNSFLTQLGLPSFLKTSGGKGLHIVVPVKRLHDWDTVKGFAQAAVEHMAKTIPKRFVARSGPKNRVGRIFIDYLRNGRGATTVCAWSSRARPGLGISVPVAWGELPSLRGGDHWCVKTVHQRLDSGNQPWAGYAKAARGLTAAMSLLGYAPPSA